MKKQRIFAVVMAAVMTLSLVACGEKQTGNDVTPTTAPTTAPTQAPVVDPEPTQAPAPGNVTIADASITFEDGNYAFVAPYMKHVTSAEIELSVADYNGSKALKVVNLNGKAPWIAIDVNTLLGANAAKVAGVEMVVGTTYGDGNFYSTSGSIMSWWGTDLTQNTLGSWSIYMEKKNPKVISAKIPAGNELIADANNIIMINLATDNGMTEGASGGYATLYVDDIRFFDANGNTLTADTTVAFVNPAGFANEGHDSNLLYVNNAVELMGEVSAAGWAQAGVDLTDEQRALFVPGSVLEVAYECADPVWMIAIGENPLGGWLRAVDQTSYVVDGYVSSDKTVVQYTYEQLEAWWGEGFEQYLTTLQCEGKSDWKVYSVKIGTQSTMADLGANKTQLCGEVSAAGWAQAGVESFTDEMRALFKPGTVLEIAYECADPVWPIAIGENPLGGWLRAVDQTSYVVDGAVNADGTCVQYTYEQLAAWWGDGFEQYLDKLHVEGKSDWKAFSVSIGPAFKPQTNVTELEGFAVNAGGWAQAGIDLTDEQRAMLKPGAVITVNYECADPVWLIAIGENPLGGWLRAVDQNTFLVDGAVNEDNTCVQYTYEQLAAYWGDGFEQYLTTLQAEGKSDWKVYSVTIGQGPAAAAPVEEEEKLEAPDPTIQVADGEVVHTGSITFADSAWWTQNEMKYVDIFGDVDPATVTAVRFYSDTNFVLGYQDTYASVWAQYDNAAEYVVKTMELVKETEDTSVCIICLSKGDGVEYTINWEVYTGGSTDIVIPEKPAEVVIDATNDTIEGTVIHTGSITFADSAWWTQNEMKYADIFGDLDPATVAGVKFYSDTVFVLGFTNVETEGWEQYDKNDTYVAKKMMLNKPEGESVCIICLSKGDGVEYTINWEVYGKAADPLTDTIEGNVAHTGTMTFADSAWWTQKEVTVTDLLGDIDPATVKGVKFTADTTFVLGYTNADTGAWDQYQDAKASDVYVVKNMDFNKAEGESVCIICLSKGDGVEYTINWEVYTDGEAAEAPAADGLVINFADLTAGGYGYEAALNGDAVDVTIASQYQEIQYILPEAVVLADYTSLVVDVVSNAQIDVKLVNSDAVLNEYSQKTPFLDYYTDGAVTAPLTIDLAAYADKDLSQINFMAMGNDVAFTIKSITFVK